jgi:hypothetical protein
MSKDASTFCAVMSTPESLSFWTYSTAAVVWPGNARAWLAWPIVHKPGPAARAPAVVDASAAAAACAPGRVAAVPAKKLSRDHP